MTKVQQIGCVQARILVDHFKSAENIFKAKTSLLEKIDGIGQVRAKSIKAFNDFKSIEKEIKFIEKYKIIPLFLTNPSYPRRLLNCYDPPTVLFYRGRANLNAARIVSIIGTRTYTEYGKQLTESFVETLATQDVLIVSGLAFGIDALAHRACVKHNLSTVGVLAHGLDQIYPSQHTNLAKEMVKQGGGLLTEFPSTTKPDKHNFPTRNRIVAGISDAVIVVESGIKGGSMVTAELANGYNKDVFAVPGRVSDIKSSGCNHLIKNNKAILINNADELIEMMGWLETQQSKPKKQKELFVQLSENEKCIASLLMDHQQLSIDELNIRSGLSGTEVAACILNLELQNIVQRLPGKMYVMM